MNQLSEMCQTGLIDGRSALSGCLDRRTCRHVDSWLSRATPRELDVSEVTSFDSCGLRVLINARLRDPKFRIVNPSEAVRRLLHSSGTFEYLSGINCASRANGRQKLS
jgi:anti-anti-sigma factor